MRKGCNRVSGAPFPAVLTWTSQKGGLGIMLLVLNPAAWSPLHVSHFSAVRPARSLTMAVNLEESARRAARTASQLDSFERNVLLQVLAMGHAAVDLFLKSQGNGDLGSTVTTAEGTILSRGEKLQTHRLRTIFGEHFYAAFVYSRGLKQKIELRPLDARLNLPDGIASYLNASDAADAFHVWRQREGAERVHPHRQLVESYAGFKA